VTAGKEESIRGLQI